jgi:hypothetical protein
MLTNREAISRLKRMLREINADSRLTDRTVYSLLENHAKWLIYRESEKLRLLKKDDVYQSYKCVEVIEAPIIDPCCGIRSDCTIYRTKNKIPPIYEDSFGVIIKSVTTIDNGVSLTPIKASEWERKNKNPWLSEDNKNKFYFYFDGYLYFPKGSWKKVNIFALYKKDISDLNLCENDNTPCNDETKKCKRFLDKQFIIPDYLEAQMFDSAIKDLSNTYKRFPEKSNEINKNDNK